MIESRCVFAKEFIFTNNTRNGHAIPLGTQRKRKRERERERRGKHLFVLNWAGHEALMKITTKRILRVKK